MFSLYNKYGDRIACEAFSQLSVVLRKSLVVMTAGKRVKGKDTKTMEFQL